MSWFRRQALYRVLEADKGAGSGGGTSDGDGKNTDQKDNNKGGADDKSKADDKGGSSGGNKKDDESGDKSDPDKKFTQADIDRAITDRLAREKEKADREAKEKQGEFEKLYVEVKPKFEEVTAKLDSVTKERDQYATMLSTNMQAEIKDWPKELKDQFDPTISLANQRKWIDQNAPIAKRLVGQKIAPINGEHGDKGGKGNDPVRNYLGSRYTGAGIVPPKK